MLETGDIRTSDTFMNSKNHQNVQTWIAEWESPLLSQISNRQEQFFYKLQNHLTAFFKTHDLKRAFRSNIWQI